MTYVSQAPYTASVAALRIPLALWITTMAERLGTTSKDGPKSDANLPYSRVHISGSLEACHVSQGLFERLHHRIPKAFPSTVVLYMTSSAIRHH